MMCLSCGCGKPNDDHGDSRHITLEQLKEAAAAAGVSVEEAAKNVQSGAQGNSAKGEPR